MTDLALRPLLDRPFNGPVVLAILDGVGLGARDEGDAFFQADMPFLKGLLQSPLATELLAHGTAVGMPTDKDMGNSEVGHNVMGAGRSFPQGATLVQQAIDSENLFAAETWKRATDNARSTTLHLLGLLSDGNVHSHIDHAIALAKRAHQDGVPRIRFHILLDGRDVAKTSALRYVDQLEAFMEELRATGCDIAVASGGGRMTITMDRYEADWPMVARGWRTHVHGDAPTFASTRQAIEHARHETPGIIDQDLPAFAVKDDQGETSPIRDGDSVIAFNFRGDRMLELCRVFEDEAFDKFDRGTRPNVFFAGMVQYDGDTQTPAHYLIAPPPVEHPLSELLSAAGVAQFACSETQKFGHVTYFWNGNRSASFPNEVTREVPSHAPPFDARPEMRAAEITDLLCEALESGTYGFLRANYANGDMVGHTGNVSATVRSLACVDTHLARLDDSVRKAGGVLVITADHGNADDMIEKDKDGAFVLEDGKPSPKTSHSLNPVPFAVCARPDVLERLTLTSVQQPSLANLAATLAILSGYEPPTTYAAPLISWQ